MSHEGTNWAIRQKGLKPATKLVLWYLCDRHNPDFGCFPRQDRLAAEAEMSVSSLNDHLRILEERGLIRRIKRSDPKTKQQLSTLYILGFEDRFTLNPVPNSGVGPEGDNSPDPVEKPVDNVGKSCEMPTPETTEKPTPESGAYRISVRRLTSKEEDAGASASANPQPFAMTEAEMDELIRIAGHNSDGELPSWWQGDKARDHVAGWAKKFGFSAARILAVARQSRTGHDKPAEGPKAFDKAMKRSAESGAAPTSDNPNRPRSQEEICEYFAGLINGQGYIPPNVPSASTVHEILKRGLVTPARMKERGLL